MHILCRAMHVWFYRDEISAYKRLKEAMHIWFMEITTNRKGNSSDPLFTLFLSASFICYAIDVIAPGGFSSLLTHYTAPHYNLHFRSCMHYLQWYTFDSCKLEIVLLECFRTALSRACSVSKCYSSMWVRTVHACFFTILSWLYCISALISVLCLLPMILI